MASRRKVYVIGAGFSAGLGYPLTSNLLIEAWSKMTPMPRLALEKVIRFHYPSFNPEQKTSFPYIEQLLTKMRVNRDMFDMSRPAEGGFTKAELADVEANLLLTVANWFHDIFEKIDTQQWLGDFVQRLRSERAIVISFNWDLVLDHYLFSGEATAQSYGLEGMHKDVVLLKPHGSLSWYKSDEVQYVKDKKRLTIFDGVEAFKLPRSIKSRKGRRYSPLIVAPSYLKDFEEKIFQKTWQTCTDALSTAREICFIGYSLPPDDMQAQFILRCGFYNQAHGRLKKNGGRFKPTGPSKVTIVNPDQEAAKRIEATVEAGVACEWIPDRVQGWLESQ